MYHGWNKEYGPRKTDQNNYLNPEYNKYVYNSVETQLNKELEHKALIPAICNI